MALFRENVYEKAVARTWKNPEDRTRILAELAEMGISASQAIPLVLSPDPDVRKLGVDTFQAAPSELAIRQLLKAVKGKPTSARKFAHRVLADADHGLLSRTVGHLLSDRDEEIVEHGWELGFVLNAEHIYAFLVRAIRQGPDRVRQDAVEKLAESFPIDKTRVTLIAASADPNSNVVYRAVRGLTKDQSEETADLMTRFFLEGEPHIQEVAADYIKQYGRSTGPLRARLIQMLPAVRDAQRARLVDVMLNNDNATEVLLETITFSLGLVGWLRSRILNTFKLVGGPVLEASLALLANPDPAIKTNALMLAAEFENPMSIEPVSTLLEADDWWLRIMACHTLGRLKDARAVPVLTKALADPEARWAAIDSLATIGGPDALEALRPMFDEEREDVRLHAVRALSGIKDATLVPILLQVARKDASTDVRAAAIETLRDLTHELDLSEQNLDAELAALTQDELDRPIDKILAKARELGASDIHISPGEPPMARINGRIERIRQWPVLTPEQSSALVGSITPKRYRAVVAARGEADFCHAIPHVGRHRANVYQHRRGVCAVFRVIPNSPPNFADLRIPEKLHDILHLHQGLVVVSGKTGSGKSSTIAAMVNLINANKNLHIITLEDPIETLHPIKKSLIVQRSVGEHTESFSRALRATLREDPDVIVVGEMRDSETISMALHAAETGHLVITTLHASRAHQAVDRLIKSFPPEEQPQIRMALSESLKIVTYQTLLPVPGGGRRVACFEVLRGIPSAAAMIREDKIHQLPGLMQTSAQHGMRTLDMALMQLVKTKRIEPEVAWTRADQPELFEEFCSPEFLAQMGEKAAEGEEGGMA